MHKKLGTIKRLFSLKLKNTYDLSNWEHFLPRNLRIYLPQRPPTPGLLAHDIELGDLSESDEAAPEDLVLELH